MKDKIKLRNKAKLLEPVIRIGKNGITPGIVGELKKQLKKKKLIKIKLLRSFAAEKDKKKIAKQLEQQTNSEIIDVIGNVIVLHKTHLIENNLNKKSYINQKR